MKLKLFNKETFPRVAGRVSIDESTISFQKKGKISFSPTALQVLFGEHNPSPIMLVQDENSTEDWYVVKDTTLGFDIKLDGKGRNYLNHKTLYEEFLKSINLEPTKTYRFKLSKTPLDLGEGMEGYCIVIAKPVVSDRILKHAKK